MDPSLTVSLVFLHTLDLFGLYMTNVFMGDSYAAVSRIYGRTKKCLRFSCITSSDVQFDGMASMEDASMCPPRWPATPEKHENLQLQDAWIKIYRYR